MYSKLLKGVMVGMAILNLTDMYIYDFRHLYGSNISIICSLIAYISISISFGMDHEEEK